MLTPGVAPGAGLLSLRDRATGFAGDLDLSAANLFGVDCGSPVMEREILFCCEGAVWAVGMEGKWF